VPVSFHTEEVTVNLTNKRLHKQWIREWILINQKTPGNLNFLFTSNERIKLMNQQYLNHNYFTDVISFDHNDANLISGDIVISVDEVKKNAEFYGVEFSDEIRRVMIHGVLHLMGYSDETQEEQEIMREKENEALHLWMKRV
jgi:probable rRNA maturation factor